MAITNFTGFEIGTSVAVFGISNATFQESSAGGYEVLVSAASGTPYVRMYTSLAPDGGGAAYTANECTCGFKFWAEEFTGTPALIGAPNTGRLRLGDGVLTIHDEDDTLYGSIKYNLGWNTVQICHVRGEGMMVKVGGRTAGPFSMATINNGFNLARLGSYVDAVTGQYTVHFKDFWFDDAAYQWRDVTGIYAHAVNGGSSYTGWTQSPYGPPWYLTVNELPIDGDDTYLYASSPGVSFTVALRDRSRKWDKHATHYKATAICRATGIVASCMTTLTLGAASYQVAQANSCSTSYKGQSVMRALSAGEDTASIGVTVLNVLSYPIRCTSVLVEELEEKNPDVVSRGNRSMLPPNYVFNSWYGIGR